MFGYILASIFFILLCISIIIIISLSRKSNNEYYDEKITYNKELLEFINEMVKKEVIRVVQYPLLLGTPYNVKNIDTDIRKISEKVQKSLKPEVFLDRLNIYTSEYIFDYIVQETMSMILEVVKASKETNAILN